MRIWGASSSRSAPPIPVSEPLRLRRLPGRWRARRHLLLGTLALWSGWAWLGYDGALLLTLWWWSQRPRTSGGIWLVEPVRVRALRTGAWRSQLLLHGSGPLEIFHDELDAADLARLRRLLKRQLATG